MASPNWLVREAKASDLGELVQIAVAAMPMDPQWDYRFPLRHRYAQDTYDFTYLKYQEFMESPQTWRIMVAEVCACPGAANRTHGRIGAFAVWEVSGLDERSKIPSPGRLTNSSLAVSSRRDADEARVAAWARTMPHAKERLFNRQYGHHHLHLQILATHPDCQRQGAGTRLCREGMDLARSRALAVTVFASPMGRKLYTKLGFQTKGNVLVQVAGEEQSVNVAALAYQPDRRRSYSQSIHMAAPTLPVLVPVAA